MSDRVSLRGTGRAPSRGAPRRGASKLRERSRVRLATHQPPRSVAEVAAREHVVAGARRWVGSATAAACAVLLAVAAFLPWVRIETAAASATGRGIDGDGVLTLALALVAALVVAADRRWSHWLLAATCGSSFATALVIGAYDLSQIGSLVDVSGLEGRVVSGVGLYLTIAAGLVGVVASALLAAHPSTTGARPAP
jgi:hypothetical protein